MFAETYIELVTDAPHFLAEMTYEALFFAAGFLVNRWYTERKLRQRDERHNHMVSK